jgi:hypothetical protein
MKWMLFVVPGIGEVCAWVDPALLVLGSMVDVACPTRIMMDPRTGEGRLAKMGETLPLNLSAIPTWREAPFVLIADISKLWDRLIVPEKRLIT